EAGLGQSGHDAPPGRQAAATTAPGWARSLPPAAAAAPAGRTRPARLESAVNTKRSGWQKTDHGKGPPAADAVCPHQRHARAEFPKMAKQPKGELVVLGFDYSPLDARVAEKARSTAERIRGRLRKTLEDLIEVGSDLLGVKEALPHGHFGRWLKAEFGW